MTVAAAATPTQRKTSPVYGYLKQASMVDFPGHMAAVMFTSGCNFRCGFCHNAALMAEWKAGIPWNDLEGALKGFREQWVDGAVITGGEPTLWGDSLAELIERCKSRGFAVKLDTNGSRPDVLATVLPLVDFVSMDVKCSLPRYREFVGFGNTDRIAESVSLICESGVDHEFRTTVIESFHTDREMRAICRTIRGAKRYVLQPFLPRDNLPDETLRRQPRTSSERLAELESLMHGCAAVVETRGD